MVLDLREPFRMTAPSRSAPGSAFTTSSFFLSGYGIALHLSLHGVVRSKQPRPAPVRMQLPCGQIQKQQAPRPPPPDRLRSTPRLTCTAERFRPRPPVPPAVATCKELSSSSPTLHPCGLAAWTPPAGSLDMRSPPAAKSTYRFVFDKTKLRFASHDRIPATTINQAQVTAVGVWASTTQPASVPVRQPEPFNHPPAAIPYRPRPCRDAQCKSNSQRLPPTNKNAVSA